MAGSVSNFPLRGVGKMNDSSPIWRFVLAALALWRVTHLVAEEDGPWDVIVRVRERLGASFLGQLMDCFYCLSLWFSLPLAIWLSSGWVGLLLHWQALSGAACLLEKISGRREIPVPVISPIEEQQHVLRSKANYVESEWELESQRR
jgi:hypothetical protein